MGRGDGEGERERRSVDELSLNVWTKFPLRHGRKLKGKKIINQSRKTLRKWVTTQDYIIA